MDMGSSMIERRERLNHARNVKETDMWRKETHPFKTIMDFAFGALFGKIVIATVTAVTITSFMTFFILGFVVFMAYGLLDNKLAKIGFYR